ncbi:acylase [Hahella sp. NBU794]|uniref:acylase n=1 Tax=Hahella sp. NBU794 TaxID=3422590 RepID=UPI003D6DAFC0
MLHLGKWPRGYRGVGLMLALGLTGCFEQPVAFDDDGVLEARIRRTEFGAPHIEADNLQSLAFGSGYAFAQDNICILADQIIKYNSQRSRYFGPDQTPGSGDSQNLINDFSYLALELRKLAEEGLDAMSDASRALLSGYASGYNKYLKDVGVDHIDPTCAGQPWVRPISDVDLLTYSLGLGLIPGASGFLTQIYVAAPPGESYLPQMADSGLPPPWTANHGAPVELAALPNKFRLGLGSNGWALGKRKTANGKGMLLANPHFPFTGNLRFWQQHLTIPGSMNVMGASVAGMPGVVNIGFNEHVAWTHTYSTAEHFVVYELKLDPEDPTGMTYFVDGERRRIQKRSYVIDVKVAPDTVFALSKDLYVSDYGPIVTHPEILPWGEASDGGFVAYSLKDANLGNFDLIDTWLGLNLSRDMADVRKVFKQFDGVIFNNTMVVDDVGDAFYIDDSTVPELSPEAETALTTDTKWRKLREQLEFTILPGDASVYDFKGPSPFSKAPKLMRFDFVQNSNDSYWLTNPASPIRGVSTLYGPVDNEQSWRSRMGQRLLTDAAGWDGRFTLPELKEALLNSRSYLGEEILEDLLAACRARGDEPVIVKGEPVDLTEGCYALSLWDGVMNADSRGGVLFREFAWQFDQDPQWRKPFSPQDPLNTPNKLDPNDKVLEQLATAIWYVQAAGLSLETTLGEAQFVEMSALDGSPSGVRFPWSGAAHIEGGFNVFNPWIKPDGTLLPRHIYSFLPGSKISAEAIGYHLTHGSSWMMAVSFTVNGPVAEGFLTYSQSANPESPYYLDQTELYSQQPRLRPLRFREQDIAAHTQSEQRIRLDIN